MSQENTWHIAIEYKQVFYCFGLCVDIIHAEIPLFYSIIVLFVRQLGKNKAKLQAITSP
jgi:hypothetical protein